MTTPNDTLTKQLQEEARKCFQSEDDGAFRMDKWDSEQLDTLIASTVQRVREEATKPYKDGISTIAKHLREAGLTKTADKIETDLQTLTQDTKE